MFILSSHLELPRDLRPFLSTYNRDCIVCQWQYMWYHLKAPQISKHLHGSLKHIAVMFCPIQNIRKCLVPFAKIATTSLYTNTANIYHWHGH